MDFNPNVVDILNERQSNLTSLSSYNYYETKIIQSIYNSTQKLNFLMRDLQTYCYKFNFSPDGNFMSVDRAVYRVEEDLSFSESSKVMDLLKAFETSFTFNNDSSKIYAAGYSANECYISMNELSLKKSSKIIFVDCPVGKITMSLLNNHLLSFSDFRGNLFLHDLRCSSSHKIKKENSSIFSLEFNHSDENKLLFTSEYKNGCFLFDIRNRQNIFHYNTVYDKKDSLSYAKYNKKGDQIFLVRDQMKPLLFFSNDQYPVYEFDESGFISYHLGYRNCCFAGPNDEFVVTSSDDGNVFLWEIPKKKNINKTFFTKINSAKYVLKHLPQTYVVDYNYQKSILACVGLYESFKFWSPFPFSAKSDPKRQPPVDKLYFNRDIDSFIENDFSTLSSSLLRSGFVSYFINLQENFQNGHSEIILTEFKEDVIIHYIKLFINDQTDDKTKSSALLEKIKDTVEKELDFKKKLLDGSYYTLFLEVIKVFHKKVFMNKSVIYLRKQLQKIKNLNEEIVVLKEKEQLNNHFETKNILKKIKIIIKSMLYDLEIIFLQSKDLYENPDFWIKILYYLFLDWEIPRESSFYFKSSSKIFKEKADKLGFIENIFSNFNGSINLDESLIFSGSEQKLDFEDDKKKFLKSKSEFLKFFEKDLSENMAELKKKLMIKKQMKESFQ